MAAARKDDVTYDKIDDMAQAAADHYVSAVEDPHEALTDSDLLNLVESRLVLATKDATQLTVALEILSNIDPADADYTRHRYLTGVAQWQSQNYSSAQKAFADVCDSGMVDPPELQVLSRFGLAMCHKRSGAIAEARRELEYILESSPIELGNNRFRFDTFTAEIRPPVWGDDTILDDAFFHLADCGGVGLPGRLVVRDAYAMILRLFPVSDHADEAERRLSELMSDR